MQPPPSMRWPLRRQFALPMVVALVVALLAISGLNIYLSVARTEEQIENQLRNVAHTLSESQFPLTDRVLAQTRGLSGAEFVLSSAAGEVLASSGVDASTRDWRSDHAESWEAVRLGDTIELAGVRYFHNAMALGGNRRPGQRQILHMLYPEQSFRQAWQHAALPPLLVGGVAAVVVAALAITIAARVTGPLAALRKQVDQIAAGNFAEMPLPERDDEVRRLVQAVNRLTQMLVEYEDQIRRAEQVRTLGQLGGGIAHQLRNAATGCRMALDLHRRECASPSGDENLEVAVRQLTLMEKYLQRFLTQTSDRPDAHRPVALNDVIDHIVELVGPSARHSGIQLRWSPSEPSPCVAGDFEALEQLIINLVRNALDAAAAECAEPDRTPTVAIEVQPDGAQVLLRVCDTGRGPGEEVRQRLFEPLVTGKPDGTGLGLPLAREIAQQHGGAIDWRRAHDQTIFEVSLPLCQTETADVQATRC